MLEPGSSVWIFKNREGVLTNTSGLLWKFRYTDKNDDGDEHTISSKDVSLRPIKLSRDQKARKWVDELREIPFVWAVAGWMASHSSRFRASSPKHLQEKTSDLLDQYGVDHEIGTTLTGEENWIDERGIGRGASGSSFTVVFDDFGFSRQFEDATKIVARATEHTQGKLSSQQWEFVLVFLLGDLQFQLSPRKPASEVKQDFQAIRSRVPSVFLKSFDAGTQGKFDSFLIHVKESADAAETVAG